MKPLANPPLTNDLTRRHPDGPEAVGHKITLMGRVTDQNCVPLAYAEIILWQACATGMYDHPNEDRAEWRDPNFCYEGRTITDSEGRYLFHTVLPGSYPVPGKADKERGLVAFRAPHIHFTVSVPGQRTFTSQILFDLYNDINKFDLVMYGKEQQERDLLTARVEPAEEGQPMLCHFDMVI
nr:hypothetical protein [Sansalvadorimonas sp. 2012CJ34-2]